MNRIIKQIVNRFNSHRLYSDGCNGYYTVSNSVKEIVNKLNLQAYPGGTSRFYAASFRAKEEIAKQYLPEGFKAEKYNLSSSIHYLLPAGHILKFHATKSVKQYHHYLGYAMKIIIIHEDGRLEQSILGKDILNNQQIHLNIPANAYVAAKIYSTNNTSIHEECAFAFIGCTSTPSWEPEDCIRVTDEELIAKFPQHAELIKTFSLNEPKKTKAQLGSNYSCRFVF